MPIASDPDCQIRLTLKSDEDKPEDSRPVFIFRHLTVRQWRKTAAIQDSLQTAESGSDAVAMILDALMPSLVNWEHLEVSGEPVSYDPAKLDDLLTLGETMELLAALLEASAGPTPDEAKKS